MVKYLHKAATAMRHLQLGSTAPPGRETDPKADLTGTWPQTRDQTAHTDCTQPECNYTNHSASVLYEITWYTSYTLLVCRAKTPMCVMQCTGDMQEAGASLASPRVVRFTGGLQAVHAAGCCCSYTIQECLLSIQLQNGS